MATDSFAFVMYVCSALFFGAAVLFVLDDALDFVRTRRAHALRNVSGDREGSAIPHEYRRKRVPLNSGTDGEVVSSRTCVNARSVDRSFMRSGEGRS